MSILSCPLCQDFSRYFAEDQRRSYFRCSQCDLVFADPATHLAPAEEKAVYDHHQNHPDDPQYRSFLNQLFQPLSSRLSPRMRGLDHGSGPGPTLSLMLEESGMKMEVYDPFYAPDRTVLNRKYDFVTCTETAEHFCHPHRDWALLLRLLRPGSWLGVMTRLRPTRQSFSQWYYKNDPTHVSFYSSNTVLWIGARYGLSIEHHDFNTVLFRKE